MPLFTLAGRRPGFRQVVVGCLATTLGLTACGGSPTAGSAGGSANGAAETVYAKAEKLSGQARTDYLVAEAKKEGRTLRLYSSYSEDAQKGLLAAFEKAYGIRVDSFRSTPEAIAQRVQQEKQAGYTKGADVLEARGFEMYRLNAAGLLRALNGPYLAKLPSSARFGGWTADRFNVIVPTWNTKMVKPGGQPTSWADLANPKWRHKLAIEQLDDNWYETMHRYLESQGSTPAQVDDLFTRIVANARVVSGHTQMQQLLAAGQFSVAVDAYTYVTEQMIAKGAPLSYRPAVAPAVAQPNGVGLMRSAQHPAAAALFYQWILTDGQRVLGQTGNTPATELPQGVKTIPLDILGYAKDSKAWSDRYDRLLRSAHK